MVKSFRISTRTAKLLFSIYILVFIGQTTATVGLWVQRGMQSSFPGDAGIYIMKISKFQIFRLIKIDKMLWICDITLQAGWSYRPVGRSRNLGEIFVHLCHFSIIPTWSGLKFRINIIVSFSALIFALIIITFPNEHDNKYDNRFNFKTHLDVQKALHTNIDG